jgi:protein-S-isoprenylcysteine O-methyltransferase Ste14
VITLAAEDAGPSLPAASSVGAGPAAWNRKGDRMLPLIYTTPAYTIAFVSLIVITRVTEVISASRWRPQRDPTARQVDRGSFVVMSIVTGGGVIVACGLAAIWTNAAIPWLEPQAPLVGMAIILLGAALRWWAIFTLGRYFTFEVAVRSTQAVVRSGPYRVVRHPSYTAILIMLLGVGLALANWASLIVMLAGGLIGLLYRVRVEERALVEALGQPYLDYMRHTKRFIPYIF